MGYTLLMNIHFGKDSDNDTRLAIKAPLTISAVNCDSQTESWNILRTATSWVKPHVFCNLRNGQFPSDYYVTVDR